jgi:hypothetical protein
MSDLFFLFGNTDEFLTEADRELGVRMRHYWKSFVTNHTAGPGGGWPAYGGAAERRYAVLDVPADSADAQWKREQCDFLDGLMMTTTTEEQGGVRRRRLRAQRRRP